jgi:two-component system response regulator PilR (NtrC family)
MNAPHALVVDDEPDIRDLIELTLSRMDVRTVTVGSLAEARRQLGEHEFDLCFTDMQLGDGNGIDLVRLIQKQAPGTPVAVITAFGSMDTAITALKEGAFDFVSKPVDLHRLRELVTHALQLRRRSNGQRNDRSDAAQQQLLGNSAPIEKLRAQVRKLARSQAPVYIHGESGSGKELVARLIHALGPRSEEPFVPVNCGAIPSELMESEFFGHRKGSFTGATSDREGLFQAASGGTLFLDEVADLPLNMQVKLLRAIQEKSVRPVGAEKEIAVDVRILCATHKDLAREVEAGRFRQDLFYRLNVIQLDVPPLRDRGDDIALLANHFLQELAAEWGIPVPRLTAPALAALSRYRFPGNVRELENALERAVTLSDDADLRPEHLRLGESVALESSPAGLLPEGERPAQRPDEPLEDYLQRIEKDLILKALSETRWNRTAAARKLGMTFRSLRYRLQKLGLDSDEGNDGQPG